MNSTRLLAGVTLLGALLLAGCSLLLVPSAAVPADASPANWQLDPDAPPPGPESSSFVAVVTERGCASGRDISGLVLPPVIEYGNEAVTVSLYVEPLPAGAQDCQGNPPTRVTVELSEPLGERQLVDGIGSAEDEAV